MFESDPLYGVALSAIICRTSSPLLEDPGSRLSSHAHQVRLPATKLVTPVRVAQRSAFYLRPALRLKAALLLSQQCSADQGQLKCLQARPCTRVNKVVQRARQHLALHALNMLSFRFEVGLQANNKTLQPGLP